MSTWVQATTLPTLLSSFVIFQNRKQNKNLSSALGSTQLASPCLSSVFREKVTKTKQTKNNSNRIPSLKKTHTSLALVTEKEGLNGPAVPSLTPWPRTTQWMPIWQLPFVKFSKLPGEMVEAPELPRGDLPMSELAATRTLPPPSIKVLMVSTLMLPPKSERSTRLSDPETQKVPLSAVRHLGGVGDAIDCGPATVNHRIAPSGGSKRLGRLPYKPLHWAILPFSQCDDPKIMARIHKLLKV